MKVLAIFTCYNRRELTRQSMELLGQNKNVTFDYVIVNDGSTDGTDEMLAAMPYEIDLINGDGGLFWNRGMYEAIEHAKKAHPDYEYYMLMNDDTKFVPGIFDEMLPLFAPDKVMVGAMCGDDGRVSYELAVSSTSRASSTKSTVRRRRTSVLTRLTRTVRSFRMTFS